MRKFVVLLGALAGLLLAVTPLASARPDASSAAAPVTLQVLSVSDWHGALDPAGGVGGAAVLSAYFQADRAENPNTLTLTAGDSIGASPPLASFFNEEPAVKAMNLMGFDADTFGNHNFDKGIAHLQSMIDLADFPYVSANLRNRDANLTGVEDFELFEVGGVTVGVVGVTNPEAPTLVFPGSFGTMEVTDPVPAANRARARAQAAGAEVTILLTHMGVTHFDSEGNAAGPLIDLANNVGGFDLILGDHTDVEYSGYHNNALVVENRSKGIKYARIAITTDPQNGRIIDRSVEFVTPVAAAVTPDPAVVAMLAPYRSQLSAANDAVIGTATGVFARGSNIERLREVPIGDLLADALRIRSATQLALTNGGGIRAPIPSPYLPANTALRRPASGYAAGPPYDVVVGDAFAVLPFGNIVVSRVVSGAQLLAALEHGYGSLPAANGKFPQISGFRVVVDTTKPAGSRVTSAALTDGTAILPGATYTLALPDFVNAGGDGYTMFADGVGTTRELMASVLKDYIQSLGTITPATDGRITLLP